MTNLQWNYVNVRHQFFFGDRSICEGTQWVVFEPNSSLRAPSPKQAQMRQYGSVSIPQEAFIAALRMGDEG